MENSWRAEEEEADSRGFIRLGTLHVLNRAGHSVVFIPEQVFLEKFGLLTMANYYLIPMDSH